MEEEMLDDQEDDGRISLRRNWLIRAYVELDDYYDDYDDYICIMT
jgi:hypothetical protein